MIRKTAPTVLPLTLEQVKSHLNLARGNDAHDSKLVDSITAATEQVEQDTAMAIHTATFLLHMDRFPRRFKLPVRPVQSVAAVTYLDADGNQQTVDPAIYELDVGRREVYLKANQSWPGTLQQRNAVEVEFIAGFGDQPAAVPSLVRQALLLIVGKWFVDPAMDSASNFAGQEAYEAIVARLLRTDYP